ncbi:MsnO8 family LLM class oxidoreductase [Marinobacterium sediminicola]|uniref:Luciferase family oxidoreductase, group 1 n=1 Tax=Marinobacterium sediminicola TaxID=518898 RepID=A0ABY1RXC5_9GAMM|nr:MsnO8 family LLM class oxidoreductase [Marinobacterium sediminicola]ULG67785.1 MsnO8 family LLM class oxidoreductase [Marinobacterium sediminicola]SMR71541.1 luciferase family oxidoreductase, group 1 [Marinobacterium sediminicola]
MNIKLSVVDQSPVHGSHSKIDAPRLTVELAKLCDELGYHRYWVAEHHDSIHFANPCPEILVATIASQTQRIRVGSGGVMLSHYSPLKVAECFKMMATLHPERIDLGVGRAPGGTGLTSHALAFPHEPHHGDLYAHQAQMLEGFVNGTLPADNPYSQINVLPDNSPKPELWMLGSSGGSAGLAGHLGYNIALARFIDPDNCHPSIFAAYTEEWKKAGHEGTPNKMLAIACICADTEEEAKLRAGTAVYRKLAAQMGMREDFLTPSEVQDRYNAMSKSDQAYYDHILKGYTVGTPDQCWQEIEALATSFGCDEISTVTVTHSHHDRMDSYRLLAKNL